MSVVLDDRLTLRLEFFALTGIAPAATPTDTADAAITAVQESPGDQINRLLLMGLWDAQRWWVDFCDPDRWVSTSSTITWSGSESTDGGRYTAVASDFLRLYGGRQFSAIRTPGGTRWGQLIDPRFRNRRGNLYYLLHGDNGDDLWICRGAAPPSDAVYDYNAMIAADDFAADDDVPDFPQQHRDLIVGFAAKRATKYAFFPGGQKGVLQVLGYLRDAQVEASRANRRTRDPGRQAHADRTVGNHLWSGVG